MTKKQQRQAILFRPALEEDVPQLVELSELCEAHPATPAQMTSCVKASFDENMPTMLFVLEVKTGVIGMVMGNIDPDASGGIGFHIARLQVHPACRRRSIGGMMLYCIENMAKRISYVVDDREYAIADREAVEGFLESTGFEKQRSAKLFSKTLDVWMKECEGPDEDGPHLSK